MANELQEIRRSAIVSTFGPGAVVDFRAEGGAVSGVAAGLEEWDRSFGPPGMRNFQTVHETRLERKLGVEGFRLPPVPDERKRGEDPDTRRLVAVRFPRWLQCPQCDRIGTEDRWSGQPGRASRTCSSCTSRAPGGRPVYVIPVRFVLACSSGHLDDFPWHWWVQHTPECTNRSGFLQLRSERPGLAGLILSCPRCRRRRSMDGVFSRATWERAFRCSGARPWLPVGNEACDQVPVAVQRGASNLYFPVTQSALSIPPWDDYLQEAIGSYWNDLVNVDDSQRLSFIEMLSKGSLAPVLEELGMTPAALAEAVERRVSSYENIETGDLRPAEFRQFVEDPGNRRDTGHEFEIRRENVPESLRAYFSTVVRAVRLREVRAITGFTRVTPPGDPDSDAAATLSVSPMGWFPAIEVRGEGIFLSLAENAVQEWEQLSGVRSRTDAINDLYRSDWAERHDDDAGDPPSISARYMLCHTLAHAIMRQLTLECGYSGATLQERIYASDGDEPMAGILVYTSTPDADGTLGGLQRQGTARRIEGIVTRAIRAMEWCSSDPLCIADMMGAEGNFSHSVCHACALAPETACETFNQFLDRAFLVGVPDHPGIGFFTGLLGEGG